MKTLIKVLLGLSLLSVTGGTAVYAQMFLATHNTGTDVEVYTVGDGSDVNYSPGDGVPTAPASALWCAFYDPNDDNADVRADVNTTYAVGYYYIGYFPSGSDFYLDITS
jgi:hypothetical protein